MVNHPNRGRDRNAAGVNPTALEVRLARESLGLTQEQAADIIYSGWRAWQEWEAGRRRMHSAMWELWRLKAGLMPAVPKPPPPKHHAPRPIC